MPRRRLAALAPAATRAAARSRIRDREQCHRPAADRTLGRALAELQRSFNGDVGNFIGLDRASGSGLCFGVPCELPRPRLSPTVAAEARNFLCFPVSLETGACPRRKTTVLAPSPAQRNRKACLWPSAARLGSGTERSAHGALLARPGRLWALWRALKRLLLPRGRSRLVAWHRASSFNSVRLAEVSVSRRLAGA